MCLKNTLLRYPSWKFCLNVLWLGITSIREFSKLSDKYRTKITVVLPVPTCRQFKCQKWTSRSLISSLDSKTTQASIRQSYRIPPHYPAFSFQKPLLGTSLFYKWTSWLGHFILTNRNCFSRRVRAYLKWVVEPLTAWLRWTVRLILKQSIANRLLMKWAFVGLVWCNSSDRQVPPLGHQQNGGIQFDDSMKRPVWRTPMKRFIL